MTACRIAQTAPERTGLSSISGAHGAPALAGVAVSLAHDERLGHLTFVVRHAEHPWLSVFGETTDSDLDRLQHLSMQIMRADHAARFVDYAEAERLAGLLAAALTKRYGADALRRFRYQAIPRGGLIVLGMLAYALDLPAGCLAAEDAPAAPLVVVDDCVLSGVRFREQWRRLGDRQVILATLFAPRALTAGEVTAERPFECVAAVELDDLAPDLYGDGYAAWVESWRARGGRSALWVGQLEYLCFAWNEPESQFLNAVTGAVEAGFRLVPPERCLHGRRFAAARPQAVQHLRDGPGPWRAGPNVVSARLGDARIAVAVFPDGRDEASSECYLLEDSAADMWTLLLEHGTIDAASQAFSNLYHVQPTRITEDMTRLAESLAQQGLLVRG